MAFKHIRWKGLTDRQTNKKRRHSDTQTVQTPRDTDSTTNGQTPDIQTARQPSRHHDIKENGQTDRQRDKQKYIHRDTMTDTKTAQQTALHHDTKTDIRRQHDRQTDRQHDRTTDR